MATESNYSAPGGKPEHPDRSMTIEAQKWASGSSTCRSQYHESHEPPYRYIVSDASAGLEVQKRMHRDPIPEDVPVKGLQGVRDAMQHLDQAGTFIATKRPCDTPPNDAPDAYQNGWIRTIRKYFHLHAHRWMQGAINCGYDASDVHAAHLVHNVHNAIICRSKWNDGRHPWVPLPNAQGASPYYPSTPVTRWLIADPRVKDTPEMRTWGCSEVCTVQRVQHERAHC